MTAGLTCARRNCLMLDRCEIIWRYSAEGCAEQSARNGLIIRIKVASARLRAAVVDWLAWPGAGADQRR